MWTHLVRHAVAEGRRSWSEPDERRPLAARGFRQADLLPGQRDWSSVTAVRSSPALRCRQTVAPLASALSREVSVADALAEGGDGSAVLELVEAHDAGDLVLCSHGDVIPEVLRALQRRGVELPPDLRWAKASIWSIERSGSTFVRALYTAAPG